MNYISKIRLSKMSLILIMSALLLGVSFSIVAIVKSAGAGLTFNLSQKAALTGAVLTRYYYIFNPDDIAADGWYCAMIRGQDLMELNDDLRAYGTCFVNDLGVFEIVVLSDYTDGNYSTIKNSEYFIQSQQATIAP